MHFQVIKDDYFQKLYELLKVNIPEFDSVFDEQDGIYPILGEFGRFIIENISNKEIRDKCFTFLNDVLENGGSKTEDAIVIQVFEQLYRHNDISNLAIDNLNGVALEVFMKFKSY